LKMQTCGVPSSIGVPELWLGAFAFDAVVRLRTGYAHHS
jgi:hypothetical protein